MSVDCAYDCGLPLNPYDQVAVREIVSWRGRHGEITAKETGRVAHLSCVLQEALAAPMTPPEAQEVLDLQV